jgi:hypothetical protein
LNQPNDSFTSIDKKGRRKERKSKKQSINQYLDDGFASILRNSFISGI